MNILLIGPRASGKTTIGRLLAARLNRPFVDLDELVRAGYPQFATVREMWDTLGEQAWRSTEAQALESTLSKDHQVVALGGGTPMIESARRRIDAQRRMGQALVIYLLAGVDDLATRIRQAHGDRPSLTGRNPAEEVEEVLRAREPVYRALADVLCDTTRRAPQKTLEEVLKSLADWQKPA